ncbi:MAG: hypothetical protein AB1779_09175, partial [Candidatus Thermoplasmatota archaeon]
MYIIVSGFSIISLIDTLTSLLIIPPIIASLSVIFIFAITRKAYNDERIALIASFLIGVASPHVFPTSHPMPGSIGDFLSVFSIFLFLLCIEKKKFFFFLLPTTFALIITHHLSTFFTIFPIAFILAVFELIRKRTNKEEMKYWLVYLIIAIFFTLIFWLIYAKPFRDEVIGKEMPISSLPIAILLSFFAVYILIKLRRRCKYIYIPKYPRSKRLYLYLSLSLSFTLVIILFASFFKVPGTTIEAKPYYFLPLAILISFSALGFTWAEYSKYGLHIYLWACALAFSLILSIFTIPKVLIPYRHVQYIILPLSIFVGAGIVIFYEIWNFDNRKLKKIVAFLIPLIFIFSSVFLAYPPKEVMGGFEEGTNAKEIESVIWLREEIGEGTIASDHRLSSFCFGFANMNATWDYAYYTLHGNLDEAKDELNNVKIPSGNKRIEYVLLSKEVKEGVALVQWETAKPMSKVSIEKFENEPFIKIYDNGDAEVYGVA